MTIKINDRITLKNNMSGIIRYIGSIEGREGEWVGLELEESKGSNDGSVEGKRYFECQAKHGLFVKYNKLAGGITKLKDKMTRTISESDLSVYENLEFNPKIHQNFESFGTPQNTEKKLSLNNTEYANAPVHSFNSHKYDSNLSMDYPHFDHQSQQHDNFLTSSSLFDIDMYGDEKSKALEQEIEKLKNENSEYKKLIQNFIDKYNSALNTITRNLDELSKKLSNVKITTTDDKERSLVLNYVKNIYEAEKKGDRANIIRNFEKFKEIMAKHKIKVD